MFIAIVVDGVEWFMKKTWSQKSRVRLPLISIRKLNNVNWKNCAQNFLKDIWIFFYKRRHCKSSFFSLTSVTFQRTYGHFLRKMTLQIIFLLRDLCYSDAQSWQSAKLFLQSLELGSPTPLAAGECAPPPFGPGGEGRVGNLRQKNNSAEDGIDGTNGYFRRNSGCSAEQKFSEFRSEPFRRRENISEFHSAEQK